MKYVLVYFFMLVSDLAVMGGTVWLVGWNGWNPWWLLGALVFSLGSSPTGLIKILRKDDYERIHPGSRISY